MLHNCLRSLGQGQMACKYLLLSYLWMDVGKLKSLWEKWVFFHLPPSTQSCLESSFKVLTACCFSGPRGSLECNPEIPAFPGEEYEVPDMPGESHGQRSLAGYSHGVARVGHD